MTRIKKSMARKLFEEGKSVIFCANNMRPEFGVMISKEDGYNKFDTVVASFSYYNCNAECGWRVAYYIAD